MMIDGLTTRIAVAQNLIWEQVKEFGEKNVKISNTPNEAWSVRIRTPEQTFVLNHLTNNTMSVIQETATKIGVEYEK